MNITVDDNGRISIGRPRFEYKTVNTSTLAGLKEAEALKAKGWRIIRTGLFDIQFERQLHRLGGVK